MSWVSSNRDAPFPDGSHGEDSSGRPRGLHRCDRPRACYTDPFHLSYRLRRKDETYITVEDKGYFFADRQGTHARMVGFVADITERIRTTQALQESETRFRRLVESNLIGIIVTDPHQIWEAN